MKIRLHESQYIYSYFAKNKVVSFLIADLSEVIKKLQKAGIAYHGPLESHLGTHSIHFMDPDGILIRVKQAGKDSLVWLRV